MSSYFDHAATAPMPDAVLDAYIRALRVVGNPSSIHSHGQHAKMLLEESREILAAGLNADPIELIFTSGGTESINTAIKGIFLKRQEAHPRPLIIAPLGEHHATVEAIEWLEKTAQAEVVWLPIDRQARIDCDALASVLAERADEVALISAIWANNELGTIQQVNELAGLAEQYAVPLHLDAVAAYGYLPVGFTHPGITAVSITAHKIGGPSGIGALLLRRNAQLEPLLHGGSHERKLRSGSQSVAAAVAFSAAFQESQSWDLQALRETSNRVIQTLTAIEGVTLGGAAELERLPGNVHLLFAGAASDSMLFLLDQQGFSVSTGSACQAGVPEVSHVLLGAGFSETEAKGALRFTFGTENTQSEVGALIAAIPAVYEQAKRVR
ncbi:MAG: cysteine desulfurase family protein [Microbacteriaceae bacterium]